MIHDAAKRAALNEAKAKVRELLKPEREAAKIRRAQQRKASAGARKAAPMKGQREPRVREPIFLAWVRRLPCIAGMIEGGCSGPIEAAHLRFSDAKVGRINAGMQAKPDDRWCSPLCRCHHQSDQHRRAERAFWERLGVDASAYAMALHEVFLAGEDGGAVVRRFAGNATPLQTATQADGFREARQTRSGCGRPNTNPNLTKEHQG